MADVQPIDQGAILRSGAALLPDIAAQIAQSRELSLREKQFGLNSQIFQAQQAQDARERAEANAYAAEVARIGQLPVAQQPGATIQLMRRFPKQSEALKRAHDTQDEAVKQANFSAMGEIYSLIQGGLVGKAAERIRQRIAADKQGGQDTSDDEQIAADLESGDEARINRAAGQVGLALSTAAGPDKFASTYGALDGKKTDFQRKYEFIKAKFGEDEAKNFARNEYDPFVESNNKYGTTFYRSSDLAGGGSGVRQGEPGNGGGNGGSGGQTGRGTPVSDAGSVAKGLFPGIQITDQRRDPNSALGRANPGSWHNKSGSAIDVKPIEGMTFSQYVKRYQDAGYTILEAKNEVGAGRSKWATGDHWHVVLGGGPGGAQRVTSKAQYDKLPSGTEFIDPKGQRRRKP